MPGKTFIRTCIAIAALAAVTLLSLFRFSLDPRFSLPRDVDVPDDAQEARYTACFESRDAAIHRRAFDTIDNPDVQREFIATERERAAADCRRRFPQRLRTVHRPLQFNVVDIEPRFGNRPEDRQP